MPLKSARGGSEKQRCLGVAGLNLEERRRPMNLSNCEAKIEECLFATYADAHLQRPLAIIRQSTRLFHTQLWSAASNSARKKERSA